MATIFTVLEIVIRGLPIKEVFKLRLVCKDCTYHHSFNYLDHMVLSNRYAVNLSPFIRKQINKFGPTALSVMCNEKYFKQMFEMKSAQYVKNLNAIAFYNYRITHMTRLTRLNIMLDLSDKKISKLSRLTNLHTLVLGGPEITNVDNVVKFMPKLKKLDLITTNVDHISVLNMLTNLTDISFSKTNTSKTDILLPLTNLRKLRINTSDITHLTALTNLQYLSSNSKSVDFSPLQYMTNLTQLHSFGTSDPTPIKFLTKLRKCTLYCAKLNNITFFSLLTNLDNLHIGSIIHCADINFISTLTKLTYLHLFCSAIKSMKPLEPLINLRHLFVSVPRDISDIGVISALTKLEKLHISGVRQRIEFQSVKLDLSSCTKLTNLFFSGFHIEPEYIFKLTSLVKLNFFDTGIEDISGITQLTNLKIFSTGRDRIEDISYVTTLTELKYLNTYSTQEIYTDFLDKLDQSKVHYSIMTPTSSHRNRVNKNEVCNINIAYNKIKQNESGKKSITIS